MIEQNSSSYATEAGGYIQVVCAGMIKWTKTGYRCRLYEKKDRKAPDCRYRRHTA